MKCPQCGNEKKNYIQEGLNRCGVCSITWPIEQAKTEIPRCISCKRCAALRVYNLEFCSDFCRRDYEEKQAATPQDNPTTQQVTSGSYSVKITAVRPQQPPEEFPENRLIPLTIVKGEQVVELPEGNFHVMLSGTFTSKPEWALSCRPGYYCLPINSASMPLIVYDKMSCMPVRLLLWDETLVKEETKSAQLRRVEDPDCQSGAFMVNSGLIEKLAARIEEDTREATIGVNLYEFGKCRDCGCPFSMPFGISACRCEGQPDYTKQLREKLEGKGSNG